MAPNTPPPAPVPRKKSAEASPPEESKPGAEQLDDLYGRAAALYAEIWPMSRGVVPKDPVHFREARERVQEVEAALRASVEDYDLFREIWGQDARILSEPLRLKKDEFILRNLADVQDDLQRVLEHDR